MGIEKLFLKEAQVKSTLKVVMRVHETKYVHQDDLCKKKAVVKTTKCTKDYPDG